MKTNFLSPLLGGAIAILWFAGCSTPATRIKANPEAFARLTARQQALVQAGPVALGFEAGKLALGDPDRTAIRTDTDGETVMAAVVTH